jgi:hypothetical protein
MKFGNEFWLILFREYISPNLFAVLDLKLVEAFARVSLARDPITSFIFWIRSLDLLRDFALTHNSETPHTK